MTTKASQLGSNPSKADEIAALLAFAANVPEHSYLASLFNQRLLNWFEGQVKGDMPTDIMDVLEYERKLTQRALAEQQVAHEQALAELKRAAQRQVDELNNAFQIREADYTETVARLERLLAEARLSMRQTTEALNAADQREAGLGATVDKLRDDLDEANERAHHWASQAQAKAEALDDAQIAIRDLKAQMFDLLVASGRI